MRIHLGPRVEFLQAEEWNGDQHSWWQTVPSCVQAQSCPTLCDSMDCSPPGSLVHGMLQARILEWVAISCSRGSCNHVGEIGMKLCKDGGAGGLPREKGPLEISSGF